MRALLEIILRAINYARLNHAPSSLGFRNSDLSLREWRKPFLGWMIEGDAQALLNAAIFFDLRPIAGASLRPGS